MNQKSYLVHFSIDKKNLEARTKLIERSLQPLINHIITPNSNFSSTILKGRSKNAHNLVEFLNDSITNFLNRSQEISNEYPNVKKEIDNEIENVKQKGIKTSEASTSFAYDPFSSEKRKIMANSSNDLLKAIGRLLAIADMIDEHYLGNLIYLIETDLINMKTSEISEEFVKNFISYSYNLKDLVNVSDRIIQNIKDPIFKQEFLLARAKLNKQALLMLTSSKADLNLPKCDIAKNLKDQQFKEANNALNAIKELMKNLKLMNETRHEKANLKKVYHNILDPLLMIDKEVNDFTLAKYNDKIYRVNLVKNLEETLQKIISSLSSNEKKDLDLIDSSRKNNIKDECNYLVSNLLELLKSYSDSNQENINKNKLEFLKRSKTIRRKVLKGIAHQFALKSRFDSIETLINVALNVNNVNELQENIQIFINNSNHLFELSHLAISVSNNIDGCNLIQIIIEKLKNLIPQIIQSAQILCLFKDSKETHVNMQTFKNHWVNEMKLLTVAIDDITLINEFLSVSEHELLFDLNKSITALDQCDVETYDKSTKRAAQRVNRICEMVYSEMNNYEPCEFTSKVYQTVSFISTKLVKDFEASAINNTKAIVQNIDKNENEFIDIARLIYDSVRDLRKALLLIPQDHYDSANDIDEEYEIKQEEISEHEKGDNEYDNYDEIEEHVGLDPSLSNTNMTEEQKEELVQQLTYFREEKNNFDREVLKWDDKSNDIIVLSKEMCVIMMRMTDFTRGRGPYKSITDIISAAKKVSDIGTKLEKLIRSLASQCPESQTKQELLSFLNSIPLFCNQLNIGSKVKENIIDPDSASSLIISSKNLMNIVIKIVKASYVASTKYTNKTGNKKPIVQWKMKPPELKPLIHNPKPNEITGLVRKGSQKIKYNPIKALSEFEI